MWKLLNEKVFTQVFKKIFFHFVAEEHQTKLIWIFYIWWSICSSWSIQVALLDFFLFRQLSAHSGWNNLVLLVLVAKTQEAKIWNYHLKLFFRFQKNETQVLTLLWRFTVGKLQCLPKVASREMLFLSGLNNFWLNRKAGGFKTLLSSLAVI